MARQEHLEILKQGVEVWNKWRRENGKIRPNLRLADLTGTNLIGIDLNRADLTKANLTGSNLTSAIINTAHLCGAKLKYANVTRANLSGANLSNADCQEATFVEAILSDTNLNDSNLSKTCLIEAYLSRTNLRRSDFTSADLTRADLAEADLSQCKLYNADFTEATLGWTILADNDLSSIKNLETVRHRGPSYISLDTLYKSGANIPEIFLHGCGVPDDFITFIPSLFGAQHAIEFYSCFISYSTKDEEFAKRLYSRLRDARIRVWFAPEDLKGGQKLYEQLERAIQMHDRLLLVLSENSLESGWVMTEIRNARRIEIEEKRRKLFPIRLVDFDTIRKWKCFDGDQGKDLAVEVREYFIPDFSMWKDHDAFETTFYRLLRDLQAEEPGQSRA